MDGLVEGEYSFQIIPEDTSAPGYLIDCASISVDEAWDSESGGTWNYTVEVLEAATGAKLKPYTGS